MPKRRPYSKVRGGCSTCKERKVRCSLERPACLNCIKLSRPCTYPTSADVHAPKSTLLHMLKSEEDHQLRSAHEVQLMHHYTAYTCLTLTDNPVLGSLWKDAVPRHAFQHRFLLQGLLAVAAHHKLREPGYRSDDLIAAANVYEQEALSTYIDLLNHITRENCHALFAFSQLIVGSYYSRLSSEFGRRGNSEKLVAGITDIFGLLKGTLAVAQEARLWLRSGDLGPMLGPGPEALLVKPYTAESVCVSATLSELSDRISGLSDNSAESRAREKSLLSTIQLLYVIFLEDSESDDLQNRIISLPIFFDQDYIKLLRSRDHASLAVLSYYGLALHRLHHVWSIEDVGARLAEAAANLAGPDWSSYVKLPLMGIRRHEEKDVVYRQQTLDSSPNLGF